MSGALRPATHARHYAEPPQKTDADGTRDWIIRAANFVALFSQAPTGPVLARDNPDEYMAVPKRSPKRMGRVSKRKANSLIMRRIDSPRRTDLSAKLGFVLNASEYPLPKTNS